MKKIIFGVCGIGNGHTQRQLPLIEHFSQSNQIVVFAYDNSFDFYTRHFKGNQRVSILEVAVPFYVGNSEGIDFEATESLGKNKKDYVGINGKTKAIAKEIIGKADLVITDYEPISAEYAYEYKIPLITIDQQSKYLAGEFPQKLNGETYADEVARLKMFFPDASVRIACSFFDVVKKKNAENVLMFPPILKKSVLLMESTPIEPPSILVYISSQKEFHQSLEEVVNICSSVPEIHFHLFSPNRPDELLAENITFYKHGDAEFITVLKNCSGIISTAGHTLLSEAMYLGVPVYAIPLAVYEQQMNAEVIDKNGFGVKAEAINRDKLKDFILNLPKLRDNIKKDKRVLLRGDGRAEIIKYIESRFFEKKI